MRVIGGDLKGRRLITPEDRAIRPSKNRTREAIFNILEARYPDRLAGGRVADLFAGTGALGIEALSRGAEHVLFVDSAQAATATIRHNLADLALTDKATVMQADAETLRPDGPFDIVFMDPPYSGAAAPALAHIATTGCLSSAAILILECDRRDPVPASDSLTLLAEKSYGNSKIALYTPAE